jgi:hypothetical protein
MDPLVQYYKRQAEHGRENIGSIYTTPYHLQRGRGLGNILAGLFRTLRPLLWSVPKSVGKEAIKSLGRETLPTGTNIIRDVAAKPPEQTTEIISRRLTASTQNIIDKLPESGRSRKLKRATTGKKVNRKKRKTGLRTIKRDILS